MCVHGQYHFGEEDEREAYYTAQNIQALEDKIHSAKQQALADAQIYTASKHAKVNKLSST